MAGWRLERGYWQGERLLFASIGMWVSDRGLMVCVFSLKAENHLEVQVLLQAAAATRCLLRKSFFLLSDE
jgi:hypothetical protein